MRILSDLASILIVIGAMLPMYAQSAAFPDKLIRLILAFPPGGGSDAVGRAGRRGAGQAPCQQVLIDNRGGASGNIASDLVARANPDGYTLLLGFSTALTVNPGLFPDLPFSIKKDLVPITELADGQYLLVTNPSVPVKSVAELIAYAKANPGKLNFASAGIGSPLHLAGELFKAKAGVDLTHLAYKGGGPATAAVLGDEAQLMFGSVLDAAPQIRGRQDDGACSHRGEAPAAASRRSYTARGRLARRRGVDLGTACSLPPERRRPSSTSCMTRRWRRSANRRWWRIEPRRIERGRQHPAGVFRTDRKGHRGVDQGHQGSRHQARNRPPWHLEALARSSLAAGHPPQNG